MSTRVDLNNNILETFDYNSISSYIDLLNATLDLCFDNSGENPAKYDLYYVLSTIVTNYSTINNNCTNIENNIEQCVEKPLKSNKDIHSNNCKEHNNSNKKENHHSKVQEELSFPELDSETIAQVFIPNRVLNMDKQVFCTSNEK